MGNILDKEVEDFKTTTEQRSVYRQQDVAFKFGWLILSIVGALLVVYLKQRIAHCAWLASNLKYYAEYVAEIIFWMCMFLAVYCFYAICATLVDNDRKAAEEKARLSEMQTFQSVSFGILLSAISWFVSCYKLLNSVKEIGK